MATRKSTRRPRPRGPRTDQDVSRALIEAGQRLQVESGFNAVSLRAVADRAGVNQAMIRYYFEDKHGFEVALLDESFDRLIERAGEPTSLRELLERLIGALNEMPWLPIQLARSVYFSTELRTHFVRSHAPRLVGAIRRAIPASREVDPGFAALSVLSMLVFPQIARPVVGKVFGVRFDDEFARSFAQHVSRLFPEEKPDE